MRGRPSAMGGSIASGPARAAPDGRRPVRSEAYARDMEHEEGRRPQSRSGARIGWQLLGVLQEGLLSLELTASRVLAAQVAGTITLWTQLSTFEDGPPEVLAWLALGLFVAGIAALGALLRPRRVTRFWDHALPPELFAAARRVRPAEEADTIEHVSTALRAQRDALERALRVSVPLGLAALSLAGIAYALERASYAP